MTKTYFYFILSVLLCFYSVSGKEYITVNDLFIGADTNPGINEGHTDGWTCDDYWGCSWHEGHNYFDADEVIDTVTGKTYDINTVQGCNDYCNDHKDCIGFHIITHSIDSTEVQKCGIMRTGNPTTPKKFDDPKQQLCDISEQGDVYGCDMIAHTITSSTFYYVNDFFQVNADNEIVPIAENIRCEAYDVTVDADLLKINQWTNSGLSFDDCHNQAPCEIGRCAELTISGINSVIPGNPLITRICAANGSGAEWAYNVEGSEDVEYTNIRCSKRRPNCVDTNVTPCNALTDCAQSDAFVRCCHTCSVYEGSMDTNAEAKKCYAPLDDTYIEDIKIPYVGMPGSTRYLDDTSDHTCREHVFQLFKDNDLNNYDTIDQFFDVQQFGEQPAESFCQFTVDECPEVKVCGSGSYTSGGQSTTLYNALSEYGQSSNIWTYQEPYYPAYAADIATGYFGYDTIPCTTTTGLNSEYCKVSTGHNRCTQCSQYLDCNGSSTATLSVRFPNDNLYTVLSSVAAEELTEATSTSFLKTEEGKTFELGVDYDEVDVIGTIYNNNNPDTPSDSKYTIPNGLIPVTNEFFINYCQLMCTEDEICIDLVFDDDKCMLINKDLSSVSTPGTMIHYKKGTTSTLTVGDVFFLNYIHVEDQHQDSYFSGYLSKGFNTGNALNIATETFLEKCTTFVDEIISGTSCTSIENAYNDNLWGDKTESISGIKITFSGPHDDVEQLRYHILGPCHTDRHKECWNGYREISDLEANSNIPFEAVRGESYANIANGMSSPTPNLVGLLYAGLNDDENEGTPNWTHLGEENNQLIIFDNVEFSNGGYFYNGGDNPFPDGIDIAQCRCGLELDGYIFHDVAPASLGYQFWPAPTNQEYYPWITDLVEGYSENNFHSTGLYSGPLCLEGVLNIDGTVCCDKCYDNNNELNCNQSGPGKNYDCTMRTNADGDAMDPSSCCPLSIIETHRACQHPEQTKCTLASSNSYGCRSSANLLQGVVPNSCSSCVTEEIDGHISAYCAEASCVDFQQGYNFFPKQGCKACEADGTHCINWPTCSTHVNEDDGATVHLTCRIAQKHDDLAWVFYLRNDDRIASESTGTDADGNEIVANTADCFEFGGENNAPPEYLDNGFNNLKIKENTVHSVGSLSFTIPNIQGLPDDTSALTADELAMFTEGDGKCWHGDDSDNSLWYLLFTSYQIVVPRNPTDEDYEPTVYNQMQVKDYRLFVRKRTVVDGTVGDTDCSEFLNEVTCVGEQLCTWDSTIGQCNGGTITVLDELDINVFSVDFKHDIEIKIRSSCDNEGELTALMPGEPYVAVTRVKYVNGSPSINAVDEIAIDVFKQQGSDSEFVFVAGGVEKFGRLFSRFLRFGDQPCIEFVPMSKVVNDQGIATFYVTGELAVGVSGQETPNNNAGNTEYDAIYNNGNGRRLKGDNNRRMLQSTTNQEAFTTIQMLDASVTNAESSVNNGESQMQQKKFPFVATLVVVSSVVVTAALVVLGMVLHASKSSASAVTSSTTKA